MEYFYIFCWQNLGAYFEKKKTIVIHLSQEKK